MAVDIFGGKPSSRDFARGEPPPAHSFEWSFLPQSAADAMARKRKVEKVVEKVVVRGETETEKKPRPWLWGIGGLLAGFAICALGHKES
jgi:hypothetical protein